jgi:hypothetical protein
VKHWAEISSAASDYLGVSVDNETRRKKQQALMLRMVERKVRERAQQLYETRGQVEGHALQDWVEAEAELLKNRALAPLYRRLRNENTPQNDESGISGADVSACETSA